MTYTRTSQRGPNKEETSQTDEQHIHTLNTILAASTEFISLFDKQGRYLYASEHAATLFGLKPSDFLGKTWQEVGLPAKFMVPFDVQHQKVMTTGQTVMVEMLFPVDTQMRWFNSVASPVVDAHGEVESVVVSWIDITEHKQVEEATSRLASIVESSGDAIFSKTLQGVITSWNSGAETLYGYTADEMIGKSVSLLIPPDRQNEMREILALIAVGETVKNHETTRMRKDGTLRDMSVTMSPIRDATGKIIGASTIAHDITKYKHMVDELATRSRELEGSNDELATRSRELEGSNDELATRSGELEGSNDELATRSRQLERSNDKLVTRSRQLEGSNKELATRSRQLEGSNDELATRSRQLERTVDELATRSHELERTVEELATRSHELEGSNDELATRSHELEGSNDELATRSRQLERSNDKLATRSSELERSNDELATRSRQLEGSNKELATRSSELERSNKELATRSSELERSNKDLSRQRDELASVNVALEEANRVRSQFLSTMSHELRTPLASIIGFSQMLLDHTAKANWNQQHQNDLERILKNGQHLLSLINDVLDMAKIEAGRMVVTYSQVDVRELLTSVVEEIQSIALARNLVLSVEVKEGVDFLESNPEKLRQIFINLVSNALKFTEQGNVTVSARRVLSSGGEADRLALAVHDSGIGIPTDVQEHIFEPFYQVDGSYTRKVGGTGLGLSIVSQLTTLLGGTIEVTSAPSQGSTFTVLLPIKAIAHYVEQDIPRLQAVHQLEVSPLLSSSEEFKRELFDEIYAVSALRESPGGQSQIILAVDDNPDVPFLIKAALKDTSYIVVGVQNPSQVIQLVQELHPCAIILDVMMPNINGWQLLYQLKANPATTSIPVVMLSVLAEATTGYVLGAEAYLIKPFQTEVLLNTLRRVITVQKDVAQVGKRETQPA